MAHRNPVANQLAGSWNMLTGNAQMRAGEELDDPERYFNGVISALQGRLQSAIGEHQAQVASDALRTQWSGLTQETKGKILMQWGQWTDNPGMMAEGVVDLMQGRFNRYIGSAARDAGTPVSDAAIALSDEAAANTRQALAALFAERPR